MGWLPDVNDELSKIAQRQRRRQLAERSAAGITADDAARIGRLGKWHPWIPAGVSMSLARAGYEPLDSAVQSISDAVVKTLADTPLGFRRPGTRVSSGSTTPERVNNAAQFIGSFRRDHYSEAANYADQLNTGGGLLGREVTPEQAYRVMQTSGSNVFDQARSLVNEASPITASRRLVSSTLGSDAVRNNWVTDEVIEPLGRHTLTGENPFARGARGVVRYGTAALQSPQQLAQAQYRTTMENIREKGVIRGVLESNPRQAPQRLRTFQQTDVGQLTIAAAEWEGVDTGTGFFVNPQSGLAQDRRAAEVRFGGTYGNGQVRTVGRDLADVFFEPGSKEFNVMSGFGDAVVALGADAAALNPALAARNARRAFRTIDHTPTGRSLQTAMGLASGTRRTVYSPAVRDAYLDSRQAARVYDKVAETTSVSRIDGWFGRKLDPEILVRLRDAETPEAVREIIATEAGAGIRTAPRIGRFDELGFQIRDRIPARAERLLGATPGRGPVNLKRTRENLDRLERTLVNTLADTNTIDSFMGRMAEAKNVTERKNVWFDVWRDVNRRLVEDFGVPKERADRLTELWVEQENGMRRYFEDQIGNRINPLASIVDGELQHAPSPHLSIDMLDEWMPVADFRDLRLEFSGGVMKALLQTETGRNAGHLRRGYTTMAALQERIWKPSVLIRGAYTIRVVGEEQLRIASAGFSAMTKHPGAYMAFLIGDSPRVERMLNKWGIHGRGDMDLFGGIIRESDEFGMAMARTGSFFDESVRLDNMIDVRKGDDAYAEALTWELGRIAADPMARVAASIAGGTPRSSALRDAVDVGADARRALPDGSTNPLLELQDTVWDNFHDLRHEMAGSRPNAATDITTRAGSDYYAGTLHHRALDKTQGNPKLLEAAATGRIDGVPLFTPNTPFMNPDAVKRIEKYMDAGPRQVVAPQVVRARGGGKGTFQPLDDLTNFGFTWIAKKPTNYLSRSQVFRQSYVDEVIGLAPKVPRAQVDDLMRWADNTHLSKADKRTIKNVAGSAADDGPLTVEELDMLAKGFALDSVKALLYDLSERGQFFDVFRLMFPFGEAWKEMVTTWSRIGKQNPKIALTAKRVLEGGRNETVGGLLGAPEGAGFFYENDNGDEMFTYPMSAQVIGLLPIGLEVPFSGRLQGLSLMTEVMPGVGPVVQIPTAAFGLPPDTPAFDGIREFLFPFGEPDSPQHPLGGMLEMIPTWLRSAARPWSPIAEDQRLYGNTMMTIAQWHVAQGHHQIAGNPDSFHEVNRLVRDSTNDAMQMTMLRGMAQWGAPSSPMYEWYVEAPDGRKLMMASLITEYRDMQQEDFQTATERFLDRYGENAFLLMQAKTITVSPGVMAPTEQGWNWVRENPWAMEEYGNTYGFFAPQGGDVSYDAYHRQLELEQRKPMDIKEFILRGNDLIAKSIYYSEREKALEKATAAGLRDLDDEQRAMMRQLNDFLEENYEGYNDVSDPRVDTDTVVDELVIAVDDERFQNAPVTAAIKDFLDLRNEVRAKSAEWLSSENTYKNGKAEDARYLRNILTRHASNLMEETPEFGPVWERVFLREIDAGLRLDDLEEEE